MKALVVVINDTLANIQAHIEANKIQPYQNYIVTENGNSVMYWAKPNPNGIYLANDGSKYNLEKTGSMQKFVVSDGTNTSDFADGDVLVLNAGSLVSVSLSGKVATVSLNSTGATAGQVLTANGTGGVSYTTIPTNYVTVVGNTETSNLAVAADGQLTSSVKISTLTNNLLKSSANGLEVAPLTLGTNAQDFLVFDAATNTLGINAIRHNQKIVAASGFATWISSVYSTANYSNGVVAPRIGDFVIDTQNVATWMCVTDTPNGTAADFVEIKADITESVTRQWFGSTNSGIAYNTTSGQFALTLDDSGSGTAITANGLKVTPANGAILDTYGVLKNGANYESTVQAYADGISLYAKKLFDGTASYYRIKGADNKVYQFEIDINGQLEYNAIPSGSATTDF